jgi:hypothetical protein
MIAFLIFFIGIVSYIIYIKYFENKIKNKFVTKLINLVLLVMVIPTALNILVTIQDKRKEEIFQERVLDAVVNQSLDPKDITKIIEEKYAEIYKKSDSDVKAWASKFSKRLLKKREQYLEVRDLNKNMAKKLELKWEPIVNFFIDEFDSRMESIKNDVNFESKKIPYQVITTKRSDESSKIIRIVKFLNGRSIKVNLFLGRVENGEVIFYPIVEFHEGDPKGRSVTAFQLRFDSGVYRVKIGHDRYANLLREITCKDDPVTDDNFRENFKAGITNLIELVVLNDDLNIE